MEIGWSENREESMNTHPRAHLELTSCPQPCGPKSWFSIRRANQRGPHGLQELIRGERFSDELVRLDH